MKRITADTVKNLRICPESPTGLIWEGNKHYLTPDGNPSGTLNKRGYYQTYVRGKIYLNHRLIFFMVHGFEPEIVDHIDNNPLNNHPDNLRAATKQENQCNCDKRSNNTSGYKGVSFDKRRGTWYGQVGSHGDIYSTPSFHTAEECHEAVKALRDSLHGCFSRDG